MSLSRCFRILPFFMRLCALAVLAVVTQPAFVSESQAQPSFRCSGNLNRVERTICRDQKLARLDSAMARIYRRKFSAANSRAKRGLKAQQTVWVTWRNTCGSNADCLNRRYHNRINGLLGRPAGGGNSAGTGSGQAGPADNVVSRSVLPDGRLETRYADGKKVRLNPRDGNRETVWPDGSTTMSLFSHGQAPTLPPLPAAYSGWGADLEDALLSILGTALSPEQLQVYKQNAAGGTYYQRVDQHIGSITFLLN